MNPCFQAQCMLRSPFQSKYDSYTPKTTLNRLVTHSHYVILLQYLCKNKHCSLGIGFFFFLYGTPSLSLSPKFLSSVKTLSSSTSHANKNLSEIPGRKDFSFLFHFFALLSQFSEDQGHFFLQSCFCAETIKMWS